MRTFITRCFLMSVVAFASSILPGTSNITKADEGVTTFRPVESRASRNRRAVRRLILDSGPYYQMRPYWDGRGYYYHPAHPPLYYQRLGPSGIYYFF